MKIAGLSGAGLAAGVGRPNDLLAAVNRPVIADGTAALQALIEGNQRFVSGHLQHPHQTAHRREELYGAQKPFAVILGCSDSRVPPEVVFDQGIGDLFVIRTAGNVADAVAIGSIEYAVATFGTPLLMVLGHQFCGAVIATVRHYPTPGSIGAVTKLIQPHVVGAENSPVGIDNAIKANARAVAVELRNRSEILGKAFREHKLGVVAARYSFATGHVQIID